MVRCFACGVRSAAGRLAQHLEIGLGKGSAHERKGFCTAEIVIAGIGSAALPLVSQAVGRRDRTDANLNFNQSLVLSAVCGACTMAAGFALARPYMNLVAADAATVAAGTTYLVWFMPALGLQFVMFAMSSALRGIGIVAPMMYVQALTVTINVILAPVLILGWGTGYALGVTGAGLASSLAVAGGVLTLWLYVQKAENYLTLDPKHWRPRMAPWRRILSVGLPAGGEFAIMFVYMATIYYALGDFGPSAQAGFSIGSRVLGLIQVPAMAIAFAAAPIIGQNFGAKNGARVKQTISHVLMVVTMVMAVATLVTQWRPELLLRSFSQDEATIADGALFLKMVSLNLVAQGLIFVCSSAFQGLGNTKPQLISSTLRLITYVVPTLWLSAQSGFRPEHIWYLSIVTTTMQALLSLWLLRRELRKRLAFP